ncbi:MAG: YitT family protein [Bacteroidetes bacterium]|nr:YitT family protein [Bacteroidota bacterium]MBU1578306.1 YitT family protein [Bacteroidota bacterium]MBU2558254.1 YitT family protein [Bacteroidota bacterium]
MAFVVKHKIFSKAWFRAYSLIFIGALLIATGYTFFITPHKIVPGGVYGISIILHHSFGTPVGLVALLFNIPLTLIGIKVLGPRFGAKTVTGFMLTSAFIDGMAWLWGSTALLNDDPLVSAIFGGAIIGLGVGLFFKAKATCGGTDVMAMMLGKWTGRPLGQLMMLVDSAIVLIGTIAFADWAIPLYSLIAIFVMGKTIDGLLEGLHVEKVAFIISQQHDIICKKIIQDYKRGATLIEAEGLFNGSSRPLIFVVLNRRELSMLQEFIHDIDPKAFMVSLNASETLGKGFRSLEEKIKQ